MTSRSHSFSRTGSISWRLCTLCPLLVTAIIFWERLTAIFTGKSPKGNERPAGKTPQPFGNKTAFFSVSVLAAGWAKAPAANKHNAIDKKGFIALNFFDLLPINFRNQLVKLELNFD